MLLCIFIHPYNHFWIPDEIADSVHLQEANGKQELIRTCTPVSALVIFKLLGLQNVEKIEIGTTR